MAKGSSSPLRSALASRGPDTPYQIAKALDLPSDTPFLQSKSKTHNNNDRKPTQRRNAPLPTIDEGYLGATSNDWTAVAQAHYKAVNAAQDNEIKECYKHQSNLHSALNHIFASSKGNLLLPALHKVCRNTLLVAQAQYNQQQSATKISDPSILQNAVNLLQESFSRCLNDRSEFLPNAPLSEEGSKKAGVLYVVIQLFRLYFELHTLRLCKNLLRPVEAYKLHIISGRQGDQVTYRYYVGRLHMFEDQYDLAEEHLDFALQHCHKDAHHNKQCILRYLVPVKLLRGRLPSDTLLQKYGLLEFNDLVKSIRIGDLKSFNEGIQKYQDVFIRRGIYLLLEKCKIVCYRNLFKRIHKVVDKPQLALPIIKNAFHWLRMDVDLDEVECILANLIFRGYIRGYISHAKRTLVLSKTNPFPTSAVILKK